MPELTSRQETILLFIMKFQDKHGYSCSYRDIGDRFNITTGTVQTPVRALRHKGYLNYKYISQKARCFVTTDKARRYKEALNKEAVTK